MLGEGTKVFHRLKPCHRSFSHSTNTHRVPVGSRTPKNLPSGSGELWCRRKGRKSKQVNKGRSPAGGTRPGGVRGEFAAGPGRLHGGALFELRPEWQEGVTSRGPREGVQAAGRQEADGPGPSSPAFSVQGVGARGTGVRGGCRQQVLADREAFGWVSEPEPFRKSARRGPRALRGPSCPLFCAKSPVLRCSPDISHGAERREPCASPRVRPRRACACTCM